MKAVPELLPALEAAAFDQATVQELAQLRAAAAADPAVARWIAAELRLMVALHLASARSDDDLHERVLRLISAERPSKRYRIADEVVQSLPAKPSRRPRIRAWWPAILAATLMLAVGSAWWRSEHRRELPRLERATGQSVAVTPGERLATDETARLTWADGSRLTLQPAGDFRLDDRGWLRIERGQIEAQVARRERRDAFLISTPHARIEVVGTAFSVETRSDGTRVRVSEGRVRIGNGQGSVEAVPPQVVWCAPGRPPAVDPYLSQDARRASEVPGFLGADGTAMRDRNGSGAVVVLRGVKLTGWLKWEPWMSPIDRSRAVPELNGTGNGYDSDLRALLTRRFGAETAHELITTYQDHWITTRDLDLIQAQGLNLVRVPLCYDHLLDGQGQWRGDAFRHLDWLIAEAWRRGIWTVPCLQGYLPPVARQDGSADGYWSDRAMQAETVRIWTRIAERYRAIPGVAMYDLIDEPTNSTPTGGRPPSAATVGALYDRLYHAIRTVDPYHLIAMQGLWGWNSLPDPQAAGYRNVVYSFHWYNWQAKTSAQRMAGIAGDLADVRAMRERWQVPVLIGEFNHFDDAAAWRAAIDQYERAGLSWCMAGWKTIAGTTNAWGLLTTRAGPLPPVPDLSRDPAATIRAAWSAWDSSDRLFGCNPMLAPLVRGPSVPASASGAAGRAPSVGAGFPR